MNFDVFAFVNGAVFSLSLDQLVVTVACNQGWVERFLSDAVKLSFGTFHSPWPMGSLRCPA
eukprot:1885943-Amphidinium_carterae.1